MASKCTSRSVIAVTSGGYHSSYSEVGLLYSMFAGRLSQATLRALDWLTSHTLPPDDLPPHQRTGRRGEEDAYFYLRRKGYVIIARNYRSPHHGGELDLVGWDKDTLCFIEVKTRTTRDVKPAEAAVDRDKERELRLVCPRLSSPDATLVPVPLRCAGHILRSAPRVVVRAVSKRLFRVVQSLACGLKPRKGPTERI